MQLCNGLPSGGFRDSLNRCDSLEDEPRLLAVPIRQPRGRTHPWLCGESGWQVRVSGPITYTPAIADLGKQRYAAIFD